MSDNLRMKIENALQKSHFGLSTREISDDLQMRYKPVLSLLLQLEQESMIEKIETGKNVLIWRLLKNGHDDLKKQKKLVQLSNDIQNEDISTVNLENFELFQIMDDAREKVICFMKSKPLKTPVENLETKIKTLEGLADITSPQIAKVLNAVICDLRS